MTQLLNLVNEDCAKEGLEPVCSQTAPASALHLFNRNRSSSKASQLPTPDPNDPTRFQPPSSITTSTSSKNTNTNSNFYSLWMSLFRAGPITFLIRLFQPDKYEQAVYKYMVESRETDMEEAQANMDAYFE